jgi:glucose dehydrogenase
MPPTRDFPLAGGSYANQRYSALNQINRSNITKLGAVWSMRVEERNLGGTLDGTPVVLDGVMYITTGAKNVLAIDVKTGEVKWRYRPESEEGKTGANKGVVVADGKVVFGRRDNMLMALDQHTGRVVWQTPTTTQRAAYSSAAPVY